MAIETPPPITPLDSPAPQRGDRATFFSRVDSFILWFVGAVSQYTALAANVFNNATEAFAAAVRSKDSAAEAKAAAETAAATTNASFFVPDRAYVRGDCAISNITYLTYRRRAGGGAALDPANDRDNWVLVTPNVTPVASATVNSGSDIVLVAGSAGNQVISMTERGRAVWLPKANAMQGMGGPVFVIRNDGGYAFGIRDSTGLLIAAVAPTGTAMLTLEDKSSEAGRWGVTGTCLEPGLLAAEHTFGATVGVSTSAPYYPEFVALDDFTSIHMVPLIAGGFGAVIVDYRGRTVSLPVTIDATLYAKPSRLFKVSATQALLFYATPSREGRAVLLTVKGASPSLSLAIGTSAIVPVAGYYSAWDGDDGTNAQRIEQLSPTLYFYAYASSTVSGLVSCFAMSVVDDKIVVGATAAVTSAGVAEAGGGASPTSYALSASSVLVLYQAYSSANGLLARVVTVNGPAEPACTIGPSCNVKKSVSNGSSYTPSYSVCMLTPERILLMSDAGSYASTFVIALNISGTTITAGTAVALAQFPVNFVSGSSQIGSPGDGRYTPRLYRLSPTQALLSLVGTEPLGDVSVPVSISAVVAYADGAVSIGPQSHRLFADGVLGGTGFVVPGGGLDFCTIMARPQPGTGAVYGYKVDSATNAVIAAGAAPLHGAQGVEGDDLHATRTSKGLYVIHGSGSANYAAARPNLLGLTAVSVYSTDAAAVPRYRGSIPVPELDNLAASGVGSRQRPRAVSANRIVTFGVGTRGMTSMSGARLRMLTIELCDLK